mgnify:CR=1 FL=1
MLHQFKYAQVDDADPGVISVEPDGDVMFALLEEDPRTTEPLVVFYADNLQSSVECRRRLFALTPDMLKAGQAVMDSVLCPA